MRIAVINTGGTISCLGEPLAPMPAAQFAQGFRDLIEPILKSKYPELELDYLVDLVFPPQGNTTLDSTNLQPSDWCEIAKRILVDYEKYDAWLILHGTDSMAYTASALPFLLCAFNSLGLPTAALDKSVVITGSQIPLFDQGPQNELTLRFATDAFQNLCAAISFAHLGIPEVTVAFRNRLFRGNRTVKVNANLEEAFDSPNLPPLAQLGTDLVLNDQLFLGGPTEQSDLLSSVPVRQRALERLAFIQERIDVTVVAILPAFPAAFDATSANLAKIITALVETGVRGLVLESYGEGNFPSGAVSAHSPGMIQMALDQAHDLGMLTIDCTQVWRGTVDFSAYAAGAWLPQSGVIDGADMTSIAAFAKMTVLMAETGWEGNDWGRTDLPQLLAQDLLGERQSTNRLDLGHHPYFYPGMTLSCPDQSARLVNDFDTGLRLQTEDGTVLWQLERAAGAPTSPKINLSSLGTAGTAAKYLSLSGSVSGRSLRLSLLSNCGETLEVIYSWQP